MKPIIVEEAWKNWADSETGEACSDPLPLADALTGIELKRNLVYRLRAAFVAGWIAKEAIDNN